MERRKVSFPPGFASAGLSTAGEEVKSGPPKQVPAGELHSTKMLPNMGRDI